MIACGTDNQARWYVSKAFFTANYEEAFPTQTPVPR
jgi:hypothetical protein